MTKNDLFSCVTFASYFFDPITNNTEHWEMNERKIILIAFLFISVSYYFLYKIRQRNYNLPPGPITLPIIGYLPFLGSRPNKTLHKLSRKYGKVFSLYLGQNLVIVCNDWTSAKEALYKTETLNRPYKLFDAIPNGFGHGGSNGKEWAYQRTFVTKTMKEIGLGGTQWDDLLQDEVHNFIREMKSKKGQILDIREALAPAFTNNILAMLFGDRLPMAHPISILFNDALDHLVEQFSTLSSSKFFPRIYDFLAILGLQGSTTTRKKLLDFNTFLRKYIKEKVQNPPHERTFLESYVKEIEHQKRNDNTYLTEDSIYGNLQVLLLGSTNTAKDALVWLLLAMAKFTDVQNKVNEEIDSVLGRDAKVSWSDRDRIPYTYGTIMESFRWKTTVATVLRMTNEDIKIQGFDVPKGAYICINQWAVHNDFEYWPDPHIFQPERYYLNGEKVINTSPESYLPFSLGRRGCPGKVIAMMEIFEYFVTIMQNFTILPPDDGIKYEAELGLSYIPKTMHLHFVSRNTA